MMANPITLLMALAESRDSALRATTRKLIPRTRSRGGRRAPGASRFRLEEGEHGHDPREEPEGLHDPHDDEGVGADGMGEQGPRGGGSAQNPPGRPDQISQRTAASPTKPVSTKVRGNCASMNPKPVTPQPRIGRSVQPPIACWKLIRRAEGGGAKGARPTGTAGGP